MRESIQTLVLIAYEADAALSLEQQADGVADDVARLLDADSTTGVEAFEVRVLTVASEAWGHSGPHEGRIAHPEEPDGEHRPPATVEGYAQVEIGLRVELADGSIEEYDPEVDPAADGPMERGPFWALYGRFQPTPTCDPLAEWIADFDDRERAFAVACAIADGRPVVWTGAAARDVEARGRVAPVSEVRSTSGEGA